MVPTIGSTKKKPTDLPQVTEKLYHIIVYYASPWVGLKLTINVSGDRHWLYVVVNRTTIRPRRPLMCVFICIESNQSALCMIAFYLQKCEWFIFFYMIVWLILGLRVIKSIHIRNLFVVKAAMLVGWRHHWIHKWSSRASLAQIGQVITIVIQK